MAFLLKTSAGSCMGLLAVEPQPEQPEPCFFVQSLSHDSEAVGIIKCPANLVSLKHLKLEVIAGCSGMIHQSTTNPLSVLHWSDEDSPHLIA